jgi:hypothetical protein
METKAVTQIEKIVRKIIEEEITLINNILDQNKVYPINEIVYVRDGVVCISNESSLCVYGWDFENDWELSNELNTGISKKLEKYNLTYDYNCGAFEVYEE